MYLLVMTKTKKKNVLSVPNNILSILSECENNRHAEKKTVNLGAET